MNSYEQYGSSYRSETPESLDKELEQQEYEQEVNTPRTEEAPAPQVLAEGEEAAPVAPPTPEAEAPDANPNEERLNTLDGFLEDSAVEIRDWIDNKLQGNQQTKEEIRTDRQGSRQETADKQEMVEEAGGDMGVVREVSRAVTSGVDKAIQDSIGAANFVGDLAKTKLGMVDEADEWNNVDHANYRGSERDLMMAEPRSAAGAFARDMVSFVTLANKVKLVTGLGAAGAASTKIGGVKGIAARVLIETGAGAIADFMIDPSDPNAAAAVQEYFPSLKDNQILSAFAMQEEDNEFTRRVKNSIEGGVMGNAVDAAARGFKGLFAFAKKIMPWKKANPGKAVSEAPQEVKDEAYSALIKALDESDIRDRQPGDPPFQYDRPGKKERLEEAKANSGTKSRQDYEPFERSAYTTKTPIGKVMADQAINADRPRHSPGSPSPYLTDNTIKQLSEAGGDMKVINKAADEIAADLEAKIKSRDPAVVAEARAVIEQWHADNPIDGYSIDANMAALLKPIVDEDGVSQSYIRTLAGNNTAKVLIADVSNQLLEIAGQSRQIVDNGMSANRQHNMIFDRLKTLTRLQIKDASQRGSGLQSLQNWLGDGSATKKKVADMDKKIEDLRTRINQGDPKAKEDMKTFVDSLNLADGDASLTTTFMDQFFALGRENLETTMYNSYLSGLATQERNIAGNLANGLIRPLSMVLGSDMGSANQRAALSMFVSFKESLGEGWKVAKTSFINNNPDPFSKTGSIRRSNTEKRIENLVAQADTDSKKIAAWLIQTQYRFLAAPWAQGATRALEAADNGFRVVSARQKARFDMVKLSIEDGIEFKPKKFERHLKSKIKDGQIVDEELLNWAKTDTFQEDLGPHMSRISDMISDLPFLKYAIPFVKTPTNILKQTATFVPGARLVAYAHADSLPGNFFKEYAQVMRGSDEVAKSVYKGREAIGAMTGISFSLMGFFGISTGAGPRDPRLRKVWEAENRPHSIKLGGVWYSNRILGPIGILMSAFSDIGMMTASPATRDTASELSAQLIYTIAGSLFEQSWAKGLFSVMDTINSVTSGDTSAIDGEKAMASMARSMIPYQAALRSWNNTLVPGIRDYNSELEKLIAESVPVAKAFMGTERTSMFTGEPVASGGLSALNQGLPFSLAEVNNDPVVQEMIKKGITIPTEFADKYKGVDLRVEDKKRLNELSKKLDLRGQMKDLFDTDWFKQSFEEWQNENPPTPREKTEWYLTAKRTFSKVRDEAIEIYRNEGTVESDRLDKELTAIEERDFYARRGNYSAASQAQELINY